MAKRAVSFVLYMSNVGKLTGKGFVNSVSPAKAPKLVSVKKDCKTARLVMW